ncbi:Mpo1 family 2-hydroxy fatty acid dioxygenase [Albibacterium bauzanense]|uniref:Putative membrane protein YGL010W n=1 Tax=Albibacterium bauzanense TaxID=653929 RepID=A0A4R1LYN4_9SPHI|nr:Mpo1-like protein [Albibacterium bauzanense]TCK83684.1 putative membrane protein YGL010W [Albibacterium bauzanense]
MNKKNIRNKKPVSKVDALFLQYADSHQNSTNILIHWICVPLIVFGIFGLVWSIPFPHIDFLGKYNGFINWASFLVAFSIYYYLKLSPTLSYGMLLIIGLFSYFIVQLEYWELAGGPALWLVCLIIFILSWIGQFIGHKIEGKKPSFLTDLKFLLIGPIWLLAKVYKKVRIPI